MASGGGGGGKEGLFPATSGSPVSAGDCGVSVMPLNRTVRRSSVLGRLSGVDLAGDHCDNVPLNAD